MNNIKIARTNACLSQKEIAITLGVSVPTVSDWESGKKFPSGKNLVKLAQVLHTTTDFLLGCEEPRTFFSEDGWHEDQIQDYNKLHSDDERRRFLAVNGYDKDHTRDAERLFPVQFQKKEPTPVPEDGPSETAQVFMPLVDKLTPDQQQLLLAQLQAWTGQNERPSPAAPGSGGGKAPGSDP